MNDKQQENTNQAASRHWVALEQLSDAYWSESRGQEKRGQEFFEKPIEYLEKLDNTPEIQFLRREFLTVMGASMAMAGLSCARRPVHKIIPYVNRPEELVIGVSTYYSSTCKECEAACGLVVKTKEGRPIKLEGNPDHPANQGAICSRGQAALLGLYDPDRLKQSLTQVRSQGGLPIGCDQALAQVASRLGPKSKVRILTTPLSGPASLAVSNAFLSTFSDAKLIEFDPLEDTSWLEARELCYGKADKVHFRFDLAPVVVTFGADFLGTWGNPVENAKQWSSLRRLEKSAQGFSKLIAFESAFTVTGSNADERYGVAPADFLCVVLGFIFEFLPAGSDLKTKLASFSLAEVAVQTGVPFQKLAAIAKLLAQNRGKSLILAGGPQGQTTDQLGLGVAVQYLNFLLGNEGVTLESTGESVTLANRGMGALIGLLAECLSDKVEVLIIHNVNLAYWFGQSAQALAALRKVGFVVTLSDHLDETAQLSDIVIAKSHSLENWSDTRTTEVVSIVQPTIRPLYATLNFEELMWGLVKKVNPGHKIALFGGWFECLQGIWKTQVFESQLSLGNKIVGTFDQFWESVLRQGFFALKKNVAVKNVFKPAALSFLGVHPKGSPGQTFLATYFTTAVADGRLANNPWLQELPEALSSVTWDNFAALSPGLATQLGVKNNDVIKIQQGVKAIELPVVVQPGLASNVVAAALGYGRISAGKVGTGVGVNLYDLGSVFDRKVVLSGQPVALSKTGKVYELAMTQWHTVTEHRPVINDVTYGQFLKKPGFAIETDPELKTSENSSMWEAHPYEGPRWGMSIDLTNCTGCQACMIACQAENNIPVVGREQVRRSRQMNWIRIDRYYSGAPDAPHVVFQPMLCQHCENAPCENVCPVLATVHDKEGLNVQVYNRCVGTRYCQNNCPYKVRRFNFFDHWKSYDQPMQMVWNPEVTVRTRGIMEKCTFCLQRIQEGKDKAKDAHDRVRDGMVMTACQQTCPTNAIVFGDMKDPSSRVALLKKSARVFYALESLNTKPVVSYLSKVRNTEAGETSE
jgi:molybdopterin-containing oxidoreductase family iron-sulfur binding subunit